jgi:hypothetical protein
MRHSVLILALIYSISSFGQQVTYPVKPIDRDKLKKEITDSSSVNFYPKLIARFENDDTTLTYDDFRYLYFGFAFQENYFPYPDLQEKRIGNEIKDKNFTTALKICDSILEKIPISLGANYNKSLVLFEKDKTDSTFVRYRTRFVNLLRAILSTGDGFSCESAFKVIFTNDEYQAMYKYFEVGFVSQSLKYPCDKMSVKASEYYDKEAIYFNVEECFRYMENSKHKN